MSKGQLADYLINEWEKRYAFDDRYKKLVQWKPFTDPETKGLRSANSRGILHERLFVFIVDKTSSMQMTELKEFLVNKKKFGLEDWCDTGEEKERSVSVCAGFMHKQKVVLPDSFLQDVLLLHSEHAHQPFEAAREQQQKQELLASVFAITRRWLTEHDNMEVELETSMAASAGEPRVRTSNRKKDQNKTIAVNNYCTGKMDIVHLVGRDITPMHKYYNTRELRHNVYILPEKNKASMEIDVPVNHVYGNLFPTYGQTVSSIHYEQSQKIKDTNVHGSMVGWTGQVWGDTVSTESMPKRRLAGLPKALEEAEAQFKFNRGLDLVEIMLNETEHMLTEAAVGLGVKVSTYKEIVDCDNRLPGKPVQHELWVTHQPMTTALKDVVKYCNDVKDSRCLRARRKQVVDFQQLKADMYVSDLEVPAAWIDNLANGLPYSLTPREQFAMFHELINNMMYLVELVLVDFYETLECLRDIKFLENSRCMNMCDMRIRREWMRGVMTIENDGKISNQWLTCTPGCGLVNRRVERLVQKVWPGGRLLLVKKMMEEGKLYRITKRRSHFKQRDFYNVNLDYGVDWGVVSEIDILPMFLTFDPLQKIALEHVKEKFPELAASDAKQIRSRHEDKGRLSRHVEMEKRLDSTYGAFESMNPVDYNIIHRMTGSLDTLYANIASWAKWTVLLRCREMIPRNPDDTFQEKFIRSANRVFTSWFSGRKNVKPRTDGLRTITIEDVLKTGSRRRAPPLHPLEKLAMAAAK